MAYHIRRRETVEQAVRRIAVEELTASIDQVGRPPSDAHEAVHELRKSCKKLRGLVRLVRPQLGEAYRRENAFFRDLSREFSFVRDAQALLEAFDRLVAHYPSEVRLEDLREVQSELARGRELAAGGEDPLVEKLRILVQPLEQAIDRVSGWTIGMDGFDAISPGLRHVYRLARDAMETAYRHPTMVNFHQWRKRVKYHWHHGLLLQRMCPALIKPHCRLADKLGELLGEDHDYAVLRDRLADLSPDEGREDLKRRLISLIDRRQAELRIEMARRGRCLQAEKPRQLAARWRVYWETAHQF